MHNPYSEGVIAGNDANTRAEDCPYRASLMVRERQDWLRGFALTKDELEIDNSSLPSFSV